MEMFEKFTNKYSVDKTLRFELKPIGKTLEHINNKGLISKDEQRAKDYKEAKKIIDEYHKWFINEGLKNFAFDVKELKNFKEIYSKLKSDKKNKTLQKSLESIQGQLRKKLSNAKGEIFKTDKEPFGKEFIESILISWLKKRYQNGQDLDHKHKIEIITKFKGWTTYFGGFEENRKNIYTEKEHSTAIGYRLIHENLPKFLENLECYENAKKLNIDFSKLKENLDDLKIESLDSVFKLEYFNQCLTQSGIDKYNQVIGGKTIDKNTKIKGFNEIINLAGQRLVSQKKGLEGDDKKAEHLLFPVLSQKKGLEENDKKEQEKKKDTYSCKMQELFKQILSDREGSSFRLEGIKSDAELCEDLQRFTFENDNLFYYNGEEHFNITERLKSTCDKNIFTILKEQADLSKVYIKNDKAITDISQEIFGQYHKSALVYYFKNELLGKDKNNNPKRFTEKQREKELKKDYFSLEKIHNALEFYTKNYESDEITDELKNKTINKPLITYFESLKITDKENHRTIDILENIKSNSKINCILEKYNNEEQELKNNKEDVLKIKNYLDSIKQLQFFLKPLVVKIKKSDEKKQNLFEKDNAFYSEFDKIYDNLSQINTLYDQVRNYLTQKPYSVEKFKLNFENATLADGWDKNKETDNTCALLLKDNKYYLAVMDKAHSTIFKNSGDDENKVAIENKCKEIQKQKEKLANKKQGTKGHKQESDKLLNLEKELSNLKLIKKEGQQYKKVVYKFFKDGTTMIPKCSTQRSEVKKHFDKNDTSFLIEKESSEGKFSSNLEITKQVFELNNTVYDKSKKEFVPRKSEDTRPKKFQKEYLQIRENEIKFKLETESKIENPAISKTDLNKFLEHKETITKIENEMTRYKKEYQEALNTWIKFCKSFLESYASTAEAEYDYKNLFEKEYESLDKFYNKLSHCIYKISFTNISENYIDQCVGEEKLYLFEIYNKDFSKEKTKKGTDNLHTIFWKALFEEENLKDVVYKLNGQAELFFRKASINIKNLFVHKVGTILKHKQYAKEWKELGLPITEQNIEDDLKGKDNITYKECEHTKYKLVQYKDTIIGKIITNKNQEITKDKRYSEDKILFHCPITCNFKAQGSSYLNQEVNEFLKDNKDVKIIGIDRGERNLLYYSVINQDGDILEQGSWNIIKNEYEKEGTKFTKEIDYHAKLDTKEKERAGARENWETIENIKELKAGYLSQVVHQLSQLIVKHNAIVVLEDLNSGFKRGRFKVEKQIYQKFEKALIDKLNYLIFKKETDSNKAGHYLKPLQLSNKFESFQKLGKQSGILFYTAAGYTSKTDPITGYMRSLYPKYKDVEQAQEFFGKFESIIFNGEHFEFSYNLKNFKGKTGNYEDEKEFDETKLDKIWTIHSRIERSTYDKNTHKLVDTNEELKKLFNEQEITLTKDLDIKEIICKKSKAEDYKENKLLAKIIAHFNRLLDMRVTDNSKAEKQEIKNDVGKVIHTIYTHNAESDFIVSPVEPFYDSRKLKDYASKDALLPQDSDANGAYNIARKGIIILQNITEDKKEDGKLRIDVFKTDWQSFAQQEELVKKQKDKWLTIENKS